ncbi:hypothetical protein ACO229_13805 [Promicromonospora sp. MS192]|uniref:hypothetical protein n=1 Tax=Promicromonospora sp. MS192 TaxID=3412684 RepID=UPI003C2D69D1
MEYVGAVALVLVLVSAVALAATPVGATVAEDLACAVRQVGDTGTPGECGDEPEPGVRVLGRDSDNGLIDELNIRTVFGADDEAPDEEYDAPTGDCQDDVTFDSSSAADESFRQVVQIDCIWYPVTMTCMFMGLPGDWFDREEADREYLEDQVQEFVACVTDGSGPPKDEEPNDEGCVDTLPTSQAFDEDAPPVVQVGCKSLPVPTGCETEWEAYKDAAPGRERAGVSGDLSVCMSEAYDSMEPECFTQVTGHVDQTAVKFLFFRFGDSEGTLIEQLGDGRVRIHILEGVEIGGGVSGETGPVSFNVAGITGYSHDTTYEFTSMEDAQEWVEWYGEYDEVSGSTGQESCTGYSYGPQYCPGLDRREERLEELAGEEAEHHVVGAADVETKKVTLSGGLTLEAEAGPVALEGSVEGGYEGEVQVESRDWSDGSYEVSYQSAGIGSFLIGAGLGGKAPFTKDKSKKEEVAGSAGGALSVEWKGTTKTNVIWDEQGRLKQMAITMDDQVLTTLKDAGVDVEAVLPYGFTAGGGYTNTEQEGTASVTEMIIDFNQYPELRETLGPAIDEVFPGGKDGALEVDDVEIDGNDTAGVEIYDVVEEFANVRGLEYDATKTTEGGHTGITWQELDLLDVEWTSVDEERILSSSSLEVTDVNGDTQVVEPAPQCAHTEFEPDEGYYTEEFSAPGSDFSLVDNDTPKYTDGTYPGTDYDGDVPGDRAERVQSLITEYSEDFPDKNILVVKDFENFDLTFVAGYEHLATVDGMDVIALDSGVVKNNGDGGWINWGFNGRYEYDRDAKIVRFEHR